MSVDTSEVDLARPVVGWLREQRWSVYQEVRVHAFGSIADIVATHETLEGRTRVMVVECKRSLTFEVIAQAQEWRHYAHWAMVAVPTVHKRSKGRALALTTLRSHGIGMLEVELSHRSVRRTIPPALNRRAMADRILGGLCDEHRDYAEAGNASGDFWSPFKATCDRLRNIVAAEPGIHLAKAVAELAGQHHYSSDTSARSSLGKWLREGKVPGVRMEREGRFVRLFLEKSA